MKYKIKINREINGGFIFEKRGEMINFISCAIDNLDGGTDYYNNPKNATITIECVGDGKEEEAEDDLW